MDKAKTFQRLSMLVVSLLLSINVMAAVNITGKVTDGEAPIPGAAVVVQGTTIGAVTDANGKFTISAPSTKSVLEASFLGYKTVVKTVGAQKVIDFVLEQDAIMADELVVVGYGVQQKSHLTGAVARVGGEDLVDMPVSDVVGALQGKITGLNIQNTTSEVGVTPQIRVRGIGSLSANSAPLVVIDGFPVEDEDGLSMVNPGDIESIEVLKDAASSAIYGSRGANGVILVTTKSGSADKPSYSVKVYSGLKYAYKLHDLFTQQEYNDYLLWEGEQGGAGASTSSKTGAYLESQLGVTDWQRVALREATNINSVQASVSGGKSAMKYFISGSYVSDEGLMLKNKVDKVNFRAKFDTELSKAITVGVNLSGTYSETTRPKNNFIDYYRTPSFLPVMHNDYTSAITGGYTGYAHGRHFSKMSVPTGSDGSFGSEQTVFSSANNNPRAILDKTVRGAESFQSIGNAYVDIDIAKGLNFRSSNGYNIRFQPSYTYAEANASKEGDPSTATYASSLSVNMLSENILSYNWKNNGHSISAMAGYTAQKTRIDYVKLAGSGFPTDNVQTLNAATVFTLVNSNGSMATGTEKSPVRVLNSYLSRLNYSYNDKYLVSASIRLDVNSRFRKGYRNGWFPSASLGWRMSEEKFMDKVDWVDMLKLRASYGTTGNDRIDTYAAWGLVMSTNYPLGESETLVPGMGSNDETRANDEIGWEQTDEWNYGLDFSSLGGRLNVTLDGYYSLTRDLLMTRSVPSFTGFVEEWTNIGKIRNRGLELTIDGMPIRKKNFDWSTSFNIAFNDPRMLELNGEEQIINMGTYNEQYLAKIGEVPVQYFGYKQIGIWESPTQIEENPHFASGIDQAGGIRVWDADGNGVLDDNDRVVLGDPYADFTWGFSNNLRYKNIDLSILIQGSQGGELYNADGYYNETMKWNKTYVVGRWASQIYTGDGQTMYYKNGQSSVLTDYLIEDASYACLRSVTLGYTFSKNVSKKLHLKGLRIYASGNNLFYMWGESYRGINPESRVNNSNPLIDGFQRGGFPITSTVTLGIDLKF